MELVERANVEAPSLGSDADVGQARTVGGEGERGADIRWDHLAEGQGDGEARGGRRRRLGPETPDHKACQERSCQNGPSSDYRQTRCMTLRLYLREAGFRRLRHRFLKLQPRVADVPQSALRILLQTAAQ